MTAASQSGGWLFLAVFVVAAVVAGAMFGLLLPSLLLVAGLGVILLAAYVMLSRVRAVTR